MNNYIEYFDDDIDLDNFNNYLDKSKKEQLDVKSMLLKQKENK